MIIEPGKHFYYKNNNFLNYQIFGHGQRTIIFLHGFGASGLNWSELLPLLDNNQYRFVIFDLIGAGYSSKPRNADYSMAANAEAIIRFINENQLNNYFIVGHSFGGGVALLATIKLLKETSMPPKALILLSTAAYNTNIPFFIDKLRIPIFGHLILTLTSAEFQARYTLERIYFDKLKVTNKTVDQYAHFMRMSDNKYALIQIAKQVIPKYSEQLSKDYKNLCVPILILWGENDPVLPLSLGKRLKDELPNATLKIIQNCGHNIQEECPDLTADEINKFLAKFEI